jgi:hypothetical protein
MGIFTSKFLDFLSTRTNFLEIVEYFCTKNLRCFFERLLYIIVRENNCNYDSLCGDIFNQQGAFQKTESIDSKTAGNKYAIRIWSA